ncbi:MAG: DUF5009 domain-containing protein [Mariniphaga sp.]|nr:DUF5009 domain-containing protein [Mariniphaga sp.]
MNNSTLKSQRILSIDALRGFDMLMIIFADRFFASLHRGAGTGFTKILADQFDHPNWFGFHFYDIIMPLFLFVVGVVIPFSISKRLTYNPDKRSLYFHLLKRFLILFALGWVCQGNILALEPGSFHIFSNTLQAIAVGYLFSSIAYIHLSKNWRYILFVSCLIVYAAILALPNIPKIGNSTLLPDQNYAIYFDRLIMGSLDDGTQYSWLLSGFGFTATVLSGLFAGELIRSEMKREKVALYLVIIGIFGIAIGLIWGIWHPIVKKIWSSSFVVFLSGICYILLAAFYWIIDVKGWKNWVLPFKIIGMNAITVYVLSHVIPFHRVAGYLLFGLEQYVGNYYQAITAIGGFGILYLILWYMYKNKTFVKI